MPALPAIMICIAAAAIFWTVLGLNLARFFVSERALRWGIAPTLGWAVFNALALPLTLLTNFTRFSAAAIAALFLGVALFVAGKAASRPRASVPQSPGIPGWGLGLAMLLAIVPAIAVLPKYVAGGVLLTAKLYDHSKIAIVDDIVRLGTPAGNPFFGEAGAHLDYYYLWHFGAAFLAKLLGIGGWDADIALTWFTAFAALTLMMGFAVHFSGRRSAALWVALLSASLSLRPVLSAILGASAYDRLIPADTGLQGWMLQASWSPQHLAGATCFVVATFLASRLAQPRGILLSVALGLVVAAGFESSAWVGGIAFAAVSLPVGLVLLLAARSEDGGRFVVGGGLAAAVALLIAFPFIRDDYVATIARHAGTPLAFHPYEVLGTAIAKPLRRVLDLPAYWLILLIVEFPAVYILGSVALVRAIGSVRPPAQKSLVVVLAIAAFGCFAITWLFTSTIMNNDLGWRAILPGLLILTVFAAAGLASWVAKPLSAAAAAALLLLLLGLPDGVILAIANGTGMPAASAATFAQSTELWAAVRRHSGPDERVVNNPLFVEDMAGSPINISWALLADRRSCFAGVNLALPFAPLPAGRIMELKALFERVFDGAASPQEVASLATTYDCRLVVITPADGAWNHDEFAASRDYRLVDEKPGRWRLYRVADKAAGPS